MRLGQKLIARGLGGSEERENLESVTVDRAVKEGREMRQWFEDEKGQKAFVCVCVYFTIFLLNFIFLLRCHLHTLF